MSAQSVSTSGLIQNYYKINNYQSFFFLGVGGMVMLDKLKIYTQQLIAGLTKKLKINLIL